MADDWLSVRPQRSDCRKQTLRCPPRPLPPPAGNEKLKSSDLVLHVKTHGMWKKKSSQRVWNKLLKQCTYCTFIRYYSLIKVYQKRTGNMHIQNVHVFSHSTLKIHYILIPLNLLCSIPFRFMQNSSKKRLVRLKLLEFTVFYVHNRSLSSPWLASFRTNTRWFNLRSKQSGCPCCFSKTETCQSLDRSPSSRTTESVWSETGSGRTNLPQLLLSLGRQQLELSVGARTDLRLLWLCLVLAVLAWTRHTYVIGTSQTRHVRAIHWLFTNREIKARPSGLVQQAQSRAYSSW